MELRHLPYATRGHFLEKEPKRHTAAINKSCPKAEKRTSATSNENGPQPKIFIVSCKSRLYLSFPIFFFFLSPQFRTSLLICQRSIYYFCHQIISLVCSISMLFFYQFILHLEMHFPVSFQVGDILLVLFLFSAVNLPEVFSTSFFMNCAACP